MKKIIGLCILILTLTTSNVYAFQQPNKYNPLGLNVYHIDNRIYLKWQTASLEVTYNVYRNDVLIGKAEHPEYTDYNISADSYYTYIIRNPRTGWEYKSDKEYIEKLVEIPSLTTAPNSKTGIVRIPTRNSLTNTMTTPSYATTIQPTIIANITPTYSYTDISSHWAKDSIEKLIQKGIYSTTDTQFNPDQTITREEFTNILARALKLPTSTYKNEFTDITTDNPNANYIQVAFDYGIIQGTTSTTFEPTKTINRAEIAAMIDRALNCAQQKIPTLKPLTDFKDSDSIPDWAKAYVQNVYSAGLVEGKTSLSDVVFDYQTETTKAENATLILRLINKIGL